MGKLQRQERQVIASLVMLGGAVIALFGDLAPNPNAAFLLAGILIGGGAATLFLLGRAN